MLSGTNRISTTSGTLRIHLEMSQEQDHCNSEASHSFEHVVIKQEPKDDLDLGIKDSSLLTEFEHVVVKEEPIDLDPGNNDIMTLSTFEHVDVKQEPSDCGNNFEIAQNDAEENEPTSSQVDSLSINEDAIGTAAEAHQDAHTHICRHHVKSDGAGEEAPMILCSMLLEYLDQENIGSTLQCQICSEDFSSRTSINKHFNTRHPRYKGSIVVRCKICKKCHRDIGLLETHLKEEHSLHWNRRVERNERYQCLDCENLFSKYVLGVANTRRLSFKNIEITRFRIPGKMFSFSYDLKEPLVTPQHTYSCILCNRETFVNELEFNLHLKTQHIDFAFRMCHICGMECCNVLDYYEHLKDCCHESCDDCEMLFDQHKNPSDFESNLHDQSCTDKSCIEPFVNECSLKLHLAIQHDHTLLQSKTSANILQCPICQVAFKNEKLFYAHCVPYSMLDTFCQPCNSVFHSKNDRDNHAVQKHGDTCQNFLCKICFIPTESSSSLDSHIMKEHNVELIHCNYCYSNVRVKPIQTIKHVAACFSEQTLVCPLCGFICEDDNLFNNHINMEILYTENYKFQCKYCLNFFCSALNLCSHLLNTKCKFCGLHLCGSKKLAIHIENEHSAAMK